MKLQEFLSRHYGVSRRKAGDLIKSGKVKVDGIVVREPWFQIREESTVEVERVKVKPQPFRRVVVLLYKPRGILSSMIFEEKGKKGLIYLLKRNSLLKALKLKGVRRIFPVGRLDYDSEGLLVLTNDGGLANRLSHPSSGVSKVYIVDVFFFLPDFTRRNRREAKSFKEELEFLSSGEKLEDGFFQPDEVKILKKELLRYEGIEFGVVYKVKVIIHSGKKRILRRFFSAKGGRVLGLKRIVMGPYQLGNLKPGEWVFCE